MEPSSTMSSSQGSEKGIRPIHGENVQTEANIARQEPPRIVKSISSDGDYVTIGDQTFKKSEFVNVFANDLDEETYRRRPRSTRLANPVPLGLASFSFCCLTLSLVNARVRGVTNANFLISAFMFFGGCIELFAGLLCFCTGDTYAMTVFSSFGGFWICWGCVNTDAFGVATAYADNPEMLTNIQGFFLAGWTVFTFLVMVCSMKSTWGLFMLLFLLTLTFLMLCIGTFISNDNVLMAGGYFGILSSCCGWYSLYCAIASPQNSYVPLIAYPMPDANVV